MALRLMIQRLKQSNPSVFRILLNTQVSSCRTISTVQQKHFNNSHILIKEKSMICNSFKFLSQQTQDSSDKTQPDNATNDNTTKSKLKQTGKLAKVFAEYGTTAVVFHTTLSLTSLGISYMAVSSGIDVVALLQKFNLIQEVTTEASIAGGATTFVIAYACHKVFMPVRIFCTVTCTPLLVKKLRQLGLLNAPVKQ